MTDQARYVLELEKWPGFFVDIGAYDGISNSNTKLLEESGWSGICFEPNLRPFNELKNNRRCQCFNYAISDSDECLDFISVSGYAEQISCLVKNTPQEHMERISYDLRSGKKEIVSVQCRKFSTIVTEKDITYISIDAETHEFSILNSIDFDYHNIKYISFERNNYDKNECGQFLESKGYKFLKQIAADHFYVKS
jgi:FkbM family methyltransferase